MVVCKCSQTFLSISENHIYEFCQNYLISEKNTQAWILSKFEKQSNKKLYHTKYKNVDSEGESFYFFPQKLFTNNEKKTALKGEAYFSG